MKYIWKSDNINLQRPWKVTITRRLEKDIRTCHTQYFGTQEEAIVWRDALIERLPPPIPHGSLNIKTDEEKAITKENKRRRDHEKIPCTTCGKLITRHHMDRHVKTHKN